ncbi:hypothetical protein Fcan01_18518 [Folsomia candida]|uniref:Uncharacterized protein n=1 Tax=Folsomia candida TaxID=158441 RepID=A0A226DRG1_FOLCA|nr:hypothetical protein Fcan01_18518 [Folsomia candida]
MVGTLSGGLVKNDLRSKLKYTRWLLLVAADACMRPYPRHSHRGFTHHNKRRPTPCTTHQPSPTTTTLSPSNNAKSHDHQWRRHNRNKHLSHSLSCGAPIKLRTIVVAMVNVMVQVETTTDKPKKVRGGHGSRIRRNGVGGRKPGGGISTWTDDLERQRGICPITS